MAESKKPLYLVLTKYWYDLIECGYKKEEYREINEYFNNRFIGKSYDKVVFVNGYHKNARRMCLEVREIVKATGNPDWGGDPDEKTWVIRLGNKLWQRG